jgi:hypothetical protein
MDRALAKARRAKRGRGRNAEIRQVATIQEPRDYDILAISKADLLQKIYEAAEPGIMTCP